ncbi:protein canopy homolog 2-like [Ruditapes philippinarum]|uniref:protein canopy homolog 2-like n=1 Tax=Ruditapes philippinarum TaxID=129788 RepID=UPI00295B60D9|nr:protein canopy homolog 2-like [Ruditapes philippinarum]
MDFTFWLHALNMLMVIKLSLGLDKDMSCAVCRAVVDEVNYSISKIDPKRKIQVGSFRVDSKGNQATYQKSYARSEVHLLEIFENLCDSFKDYAETNNDAGKRSLGRTKARDGKTLALKDIKISADIQKELKFNCETLLEEYEDEIIEIFRNEEDQNEEELICKDLAGKCTEGDLQIPMPKTEFDGMDELMKEAEEDDNKTDENKSTDTDDDELVNDYLKDNAGSIPADTVIDDIQKEKEEL